MYFFDINVTDVARDQGQDFGLALTTSQQSNVTVLLHIKGCISYITVFLSMMYFIDITSSLWVYFFYVTVKDVAGLSKPNIGDWFLSLLK